MIQGLDLDRTTEHAVMKLASAPHIFHVTGSRKAGTYTSQSDWDFFVERSAEAEYWLGDNGYISANEEDPLALPPEFYFDPSIVMLVKHCDHPIHIQVIGSKWMERKKALNDLICKPGGLQWKMFTRLPLEERVHTSIRYLEYKNTLADLWQAFLVFEGGE